MINAPNFTAGEFLPQETFKEYGALGMRYINPKIPLIIQWLRNKYGKPIIINDWVSGGKLDGRCLRILGDSAYKPYSDHNFGNAVDFNVKGVEVAQVQNDIINTFYTDLIALGVTGIEWQTPTWIHIAVSDLSLWDNIPVKNGIKLIPVPQKNV